MISIHNRSFSCKDPRVGFSFLPPVSFEIFTASFSSGVSSFLLFTGYRDPTILVYPIHNGSHVLIRMEAQKKCKQNTCLTHRLTMGCYVYACTVRLLPNCNYVNVKVYKNNIRYIRNNVIWLLIKISTVWEVPIFDIFLVRIFPHSDWIQRDTPSSLRIQSEPNAAKYGPEKLRKRTFFTQWKERTNYHHSLLYLLYCCSFNFASYKEKLINLHG